MSISCGQEAHASFNRENVNTFVDETMRRGNYETAAYQSAAADLPVVASFVALGDQNKPGPSVELGALAVRYSQNDVGLSVVTKYYLSAALMPQGHSE